MEITGTLTEKFDAVQVSATFKKRQFVIENIEEGREKFPELISLEFIQEKCDLIEKYLIGDKVTVLFNLKGRLWVSPQGENKYFNTLQAWQIHSVKDDNTYNKEPEFNQDSPAPEIPGPPQTTTSTVYLEEGVKITTKPEPVKHESSKSEQPVMPDFDGDDDQIPF